MVIFEKRQFIKNLTKITSFLHEQCSLVCISWRRFFIFRYEPAFYCSRMGKNAFGQVLTCRNRNNSKITSFFISYDSLCLNFKVLIALYLFFCDLDINLSFSFEISCQISFHVDKLRCQIASFAWTNCVTGFSFYSFVFQINFYYLFNYLLFKKKLLKNFHDLFD